MEELDKILLEQLHAAQRQQKLIKRLQTLMKNDKGLAYGEQQIKLKIQFFENMIKDKELLKQKPKKKQTKDSDLLSRNPFFQSYRFTLFATVYAYTIMSETMKDYWSFFRKSKNEKDNS